MSKIGVLEAPYWRRTTRYSLQKLLLFPTPYSLLPIPYSLFPIPYSLFPAPYSLFPIPYSLFPIPCSLFPIPCSLLPAPCSLLFLKSAPWALLFLAVRVGVVSSRIRFADCNCLLFNSSHFRSHPTRYAF